MSMTLKIFYILIRISKNNYEIYWDSLFFKE